MRFPLLLFSPPLTAFRRQLLSRHFTMAMSTPTPPKIGTHDGTFHCDEALACHMLRTLPRFSASPIIRTRNPSVLSTLDLLVDVGAVYDPSAQRFDHHQRTFASTFADAPPRNRTKLSSAGLVYKHFGREVIQQLLEKQKLSVDQPDLDRVFHKVYDSFVEAVDAIDNGVPRYYSEKPARYELSTDLASRVGRLNPEWWEKNPDQDANFLKAVKLTGTEFDDCVVRVARSWLPARAIVATAMKGRSEDDASGRVVVMREWAPWKEHLYELEREQGKVGEVLYVVYKDMTGASWRVQCVPVEGADFESRKKLPESWRGVRDDELSKIAGITKCVFVHAAGFIGGNLEFEGAMEMARKAIELH